MTMKPIFPGVFKDGKQILTKNMAPGKKVYGEKIIKKGKNEYRQWDPHRSKLGAAIMNGLKEHVKPGSKILYLGASTGTTPSHVSDILGEDGFMYGIEFAERVFRNLLDLCKNRSNIAPILADARKTEHYNWIEDCDLVFTDIAQPDEVDIAIRNADEFLKKGGLLMIAIKTQSIDVTKQPEQIYKEEKKKLEQAGYKVLQLVDLEPFEQKHALLVAKK